MKEVGLKTFIRLFILLTMVFVFSSACAYVNVKTPYDSDLNLTELGSKKGTAKATSVLWLVSWGDASYAAAAKDGGITVMKHADQEVKQYLLGLYSTWSVVVYGD
jgi:hypothetical protein